MHHSKYSEFMQILKTVKQGKHIQKNTSNRKQIIKTLIMKGYITRQPNNKHLPTIEYYLTEKGNQTLQDYKNTVKILEKIREGTRLSTDPQDQSQPD
jgi:DNA-binding MarR family transcriptional regulator